MNRTRTALSTLALGLALAAATTTAWATPSSEAGSQADQRRALYQSELAQNLQRRGEAGQRKALYQSELARNLQQRKPADQAVAALSTQRAALYQAELEHNLAHVAAPAAGNAPAAPAAGVDALPTLLLALFGGLFGGAAAMVAWTATRRRSPRPVAGA